MVAVPSDEITRWDASAKVWHLISNMQCWWVQIIFWGLNLSGIGPRKEVPNKYLQRYYHRAEVLIFCHFWKWFLFFGVCTDRKIQVKRITLYSSRRESVQFKPEDSKGKGVLLNFEFLFPLNTRYVDHMCFGSYLNLFSSVYHQF